MNTYFVAMNEDSDNVMTVTAASAEDAAKDYIADN